MSVTKRHIEDLEAQRQEGLDICLEAGTVAECENHSGIYFDGGEEVERAYALANHKINKGKISLGNGRTRKDVTDAVKAAYEDNSLSTECEECARIFR
jgi:hypothetical protein